MASRLRFIWQTDLIRLTLGDGLDSNGYILGTQSLMTGDRLLEVSYVVGIGTQSYQVERGQRKRVML